MEGLSNGPAFPCTNENRRSAQRSPVLSYWGKGRNRDSGERFGRLGENLSAVHHDTLSGNVVRFLRREEKHGRSDVLRGEWGFEGLVMTDWGAMDDRIEATLAGLDLEMPGPSPMNEKKIRKALEDGALSIEDIDKCVSRIVSMVMRGGNVEKKPYSVDAHHKIAHDMAASSFVLLENDGALPLGNGRYSLIGALAEKPRYQGAGSSRINPTKLDSIRDSLAASGMDRIFSLSVLCDRTFRRKDDIDIPALFRECYGIWNDPDMPVEEIVLKYDAVDGAFLKTMPLHHTQEILSDTGEGIIVRVRLRITNDFVMALLSRSRSLEVISPRHLRERIRDICAAALERNR